MKWTNARELLINNIVQGLHLDPKAHFKIVNQVPLYECGNYAKTKGFRIQVGTGSFINIPLNMLENLFEGAINNGEIYNNEIFAASYPKQLKNKPCHVHAAGKLFSNAGVMKMINSKNYQIVN
ncbi:MAG: hypothetical protein ABI707_02375 [Ferruginibacter sp.]